MLRGTERIGSKFFAVILGCAGAGAITAACGFSDTPGAGTGGASNNTTNPMGGSGNTSAGTGNTSAGTSNPTAGTDPGTGGSGTAGTGNPTAGTGSGGTAPTDGRAPNYELSGTFPKAPVAIPTKAGGQLKYTRVLIHNQFLAESCSIADYNNDKVPDVSAGRTWYQGPDFKTAHTFRDGHGVLPSAGNGPEIDTGVSDDWSDFPFDVNKDGNMDIINIAQCDVNEVEKTTPKNGTVQPHATAYWYENPGPAGQAGNPNWKSHLMHPDVRLEQHGLIDVNNDNFPEIYGACKNCMPPTTKGYYQGDPANPNAQWVFHSVTTAFTFPFGGLGWMHGEGGGDVDGDGFSDLLERSGAWLQQPTGAATGMWNATQCTGRDAATKRFTPAGCGYVKNNFYDGLQDSAGNKGASHMYAVDMNADGINDVVAADWAHGEGLFWYKGKADGTFEKIKFMGGANEGGFSEPHALQVVDMDGDGRPDVITGKMRFAHPYGYGDPDPDGVPVIYVFKNVDAGGGNITLMANKIEPMNTPTPADLGKPEGGMGVGRQLAVGHVNTDGIPDICVATKVGLAVFIGQ